MYTKLLFGHFLGLPYLCRDNVIYIIMKQFLLILLSLLPLVSYAEKVTEQKARELATQFLQSTRGTRSSSVSLELVYNGKHASARSSVENSPLYIFNNRSGKGFVIVSGDDAAVPVLAYSDVNNFKVENMLPNVRQWLDIYEREISYLQEHHVQASAASRAAWQRASRSEDKLVKYLKTAQWGQNEPYNSQSFRPDGANTPTGCTITALAIMMSYHQWPDRAVGTLEPYSYKWKDKTFTVPGIELGHAYHWEDMKDKYTTFEPADNVATLMRDMGVMLHSTYTFGSTFTGLNEICAKFAKHMKYDFSSKMLYKGSYSDEQWDEMMHRELNENRPVFYVGQDGPREETPNAPVHSHAFVMDGYSEKGYYHVNWGWDGFCNGLYKLSSLHPHSNGQHVPYDLSVHQWAIFNMRPNPIKDRVDLVSLSCSQQIFENNKPFDVEAVVKNVGTELYNPLSANVALVAADGTVKETVGFGFALDAIYPGQEMPFNDSNEIRCVITKPIEKGDKLCLFYQNKTTGEYTRIVSPTGKADYIDVQFKEVKEELKFSGMTSSVERYVTGVPFQLTVNTIYNTGDEPFENEFLLALTDAEGAVKEELKKWKPESAIAPGAGYTPANPMTCTLTADLQKGDRIRLLYQSKATATWVPVAAKSSDDAWEILITVGKRLSDQLAFDYDKESRLITFGMPDGTSVTVKDDQQNDLTPSLQQRGTSCSIDLNSLTTSAKQLEFDFSYAGQTYHFQVLLPTIHEIK